MLSNPLSPCYRPEGKPEIFKAGWHALVGSARPCDYEPSVCQMGVINKPLTDVVNPSQQAWFNRYSCPKGTQAGGKRPKNLNLKTVKKTVKKSKSKKTKKSVKKTVKKSTKKSVKKTVKKSRRTRSRK